MDGKVFAALSRSGFRLCWFFVSSPSSNLRNDRSSPLFEPLDAFPTTRCVDARTQSCMVIVHGRCRGESSRAPFWIMCAHTCMTSIVTQDHPASHCCKQGLVMGILPGRYQILEDEGKCSIFAIICFALEVGGE